MFSKTAEMYDLIYGSFKDYDGESRSIAALLQRLAPAAKTVLDVGCGTGEHALHLQRDHGYTIHGLDIEPAFIELARGKVPGARFSVGDMATFDLGARFDVVLCLFSSIGYLCELERVEQALRRFRTHLRPGGVAVVEPWFDPGEWQPGRVDVQSAEAGERRVVRMSHSAVEGRISRIWFHYLIGGPEGIEHRVEEHALGLFTREEMSGAFVRAGFADVEFDPEGLIGRGLYVAKRPG